MQEDTLFFIVSLINKTEDEACNLIEKMTFNSFQWSNEKGQPKRVRVKLEVDDLTLLFAEVDDITNDLTI